MRGHLSFLASDALEGRGTPSRGLDLAAEYIAAQFRRAGLEPVSPNGSYFQAADFVEVTPKLDDLRVTMRSGAQDLLFSKAEVGLNSGAALDLNGVELVRLPAQDIAGKVVIGDQQFYRRRDLLDQVRAQKPALILLVTKRSPTRMASAALLSAEAFAQAPVLTLYSEKAYSAWETKHPITVSVHAAAPEVKHVYPRNVGAILRGSDPALKDQFIILSAHYDHLGMKPEGTTGDRVFNGANDNGSGTVSVIETASALASLPVHPKRSILFLTFFGEEKGLLGAYYYTKHPLVPLAKTLANINLEQMGRTDEQDGKQVSSFAFTGPSYSGIPEVDGGSREADGRPCLSQARCRCVL